MEKQIEKAIRETLVVQNVQSVKYAVEKIITVFKGSIVELFPLDNAEQTRILFYELEAYLAEHGVIEIN